MKWLVTCSCIVALSGCSDGKQVELSSRPQSSVDALNSDLTTIDNQDNSSVSEYWLDQRNISFREAYSTRGPIVVRRKDERAFIWQTTNYSPWKIDNHTPYIVVVEHGEPMSLLTNFLGRTTEIPANWYVTGFFQGDEFSGRFTHLYSPEFPGEDDDQAPTGFAETFSITLNGKEQEFDLNNGRVFVIRGSDEDGGIKVVQMKVKLPEYRTLTSDIGMDSTAEDCYKSFHKWWESIQ